MKNRIKKILTYIRNAIALIIPDTKTIFKEKSIFDIYCEEEKIKCYNHFKKYFKNSLFLNAQGTREYAIKSALRNDPENKYTYIEFGVYKGASVNVLSKYVKKIFAFDSFEGLKEDMLGNTEAIGTFDLGKKIPKLNSNIVPIVGRVQNTLDTFLKENNPKINFVHIDLDTYNSSKFVLKKIKPFLVPNAIILFDDMYNFPGWDVGEYKALQEQFNENEYKFKVFSINDEKVVIQIT